MRISFHVNRDKPGADDVCRRLSDLAVSLGVEVCAPGSDAVPDAVVALGGDGTMLAAVHRYPGVPLLGLNLGSLGYLAGVEAPSFDSAIEALGKGEYAISKRAALEVAGTVALNDVVVSRGGSGHAARLEIEVDGKVVTRLSADGLVVATPTGSTAYSLAAGGPILLPDSRALAVTPICPHALASRPLVLPDTACILVRALARSGSDAEELAVFADGADVLSLRAGESVEVRRSPDPVPLIQLQGYNPYETLSRKLGWNGSAIR